MAQQKHLRVGLCGLGVVGAGVLHLLEQNKKALARRLGNPIQITCLGMRSPKPHLDTKGIPICQDIMEVARHPDVDVLVEAIGGETDAKALILAAISAGKHIVTANKALLAVHGCSLFSAAAKRGVLLHFEAAVAGGIPIIKVMREGLIAHRIHALRGIINGTTNCILTAMATDGEAFQDALMRAQKSGYAEEDPSLDIDGIDSAHKLAILAMLAFDMPFIFDQIYIEGISAIGPQDIQNAKALGLCIKHLAIARAQDAGYELRVHPTLLPKHSGLAQVENVMNAIELHSDVAGSMLYCGAGAGAGPTASAIVADLADIARDLSTDAMRPVYNWSQGAASDASVVPMSALSGRHYMRLSVADRAGELEKITQILSRHNIGIKTLIQNAEPKTKTDGSVWMPVVILTDQTQEKTMGDALAAIRKIAGVDEVQHIRMEDA